MIAKTFLAIWVVLGIVAAGLELGGYAHMTETIIHCAGHGGCGPR